jgi:protocatechuate 3,4-dioxygenase alpha subunit
MYFPEEEKANADDPVLRRIEHRDRIATLMARREKEICRFDIHLQGEGETVFLDI